MTFEKDILVHPVEDALCFRAPESTKEAEDAARASANNARASVGLSKEIASLQAPPIPANGVDGLFALWYSVLGLGFVTIFSLPYEISRWLGFSSVEWMLLVFTLVYLATVLLYCRSQGGKPSRESWFWAGGMLCLVAPMPFYTSLGAFQVLLLMVTAAYWTLCATGRLLGTQGGVTSNFFVLDGWNALVVVPFGNFACHCKILLKGIRLYLPKKPPRRLGAVLLGVCLALPVLVPVIMLLGKADVFFARLFGQFLTQWQAFFSAFAYGEAYQWCLRLVLSLPVTAYLFGMVYGCLHKRNTEHFKVAQVRKMADALHVLPSVSVYTVLGLVCALYLLFVALQTPYLFSAFTGTLLPGLSYSQYARAGFYELCMIASINLVLLLGANTLAKAPWETNKRLRALGGTLCGLTLLLLATAASKILLYISAYGLTSARVLGLAFLLWLALVFFAALLRLKKTFSLGRVCLMAGAVIVCMLCIFDLQSLDFPVFLSAA